jgi:U3 small nucleolar RNA-associated protein 14
MPSRISRPAEGPSKPKIQGPAKKRSQKRVLDAFAIASHEVTDSPHVRKSRLGQAEEDPRDRKRRRANQEEDEAEDSEDDEGPSTKRKRRRASVGASSEGSDSEGNTWTLGHVDQDDDSEIDSDEAFSEGDEERFAHFTFSGSKANKQKKKGHSSRRKVARNSGDDLNEDVEDYGSDDDSLGDEAIDLAQMLDDYSEDEEMADDEKVSGNADSKGDPSDDESNSNDEDDGFSDSSLGEEDEDDPNKLGRLQNLVSSLHPRTAEEKQHGVSAYETMTPSAAGIVSSEKFDIRDILESTGDAQLAKMSKSVGTIPSKTMKKDPKLAPSLPQRQKEKLDRIAANQKAKETLDRWTDSVKQMRRAEHITFPLQDSQSKKPAHDTGYLLPSITAQPVTDLESTINSILRESGLAGDEPKDDEFDDLPENTGASLQEIMAKRAELRRARDLIFREEQRSKRIKKIKSKSYRRVHRKERERLAALEKDAFEEDFGEMDDDEKEDHDRRRAQERMGAKHRDSKWAKQMKKSGRSIWDDEARSGVTEMARRNDELRKRIAGKDVRDDENDGSSSSDDEERSDEDEPTFQLRQLRKKLTKLKEDDPVEEQESGLAGMKFMKRAEESRRKQNEEDINRMVKEMNGENSEDDSSVEEAENIGRKIFGPGSKKLVARAQVPPQRTEFEEFEDSAAEDDSPLEFDSMPMVDPTLNSEIVSAAKYSNRKPVTTSNRKRVPNGESIASSEKQSRISTSSNKVKPKGQKLSAPDTEGWVTVSYDKDSEDENAASDVESEISQTEILHKAFAGDDVEEHFEKEKKATIAEEDEKIIDKTLPGWGSWIGDGVSKRELKKNKGRVMVKQDGIRPQDRKDANLKNVIMSQKRLKKNLGYMANALPFPFTNQAEYDRSIRMPIGKEWNVKKTYGENTKPRIIVKPGQVVLPMEKPLI